ncbi:MAG: antibiotic biosynthesis monooxygenase [Betaproteobacteria bacterium]|nr:antibiotic biosynthesis monooxygenase [Betaproteobacteria bacterium]
MDRMITLMVRLRAKPEKAAELEQVLQHLVVEARKEGGCVDYHFHRRVDDPCSFGFYENWRSQKDFDEHLRQPCQVEFAKVHGQYLAGDIDLEFYEMRSPYNK